MGTTGEKKEDIAFSFLARPAKKELSFQLCQKMCNLNEKMKMQFG